MQQISAMVMMISTVLWKYRAEKESQLSGIFWLVDPLDVGRSNSTLLIRLSDEVIFTVLDCVDL